MPYFLGTTSTVYVRYMVCNTPVLELLYVCMHVLELASLPIGEMLVFFFFGEVLKQICKPREKERLIYNVPLVDRKQLSESC